MERFVTFLQGKVHHKGMTTIVRMGFHLLKQATLRNLSMGKMR